MRPDAIHIESTRRATGLSFTALHLRYLALGGTATRRSVADHVLDVGRLTDVEHDLIVHALNERCLELGIEERLPYQFADPAD